MMIFYFYGIMFDVIMFMLMVFPSYYYGFHPMSLSLILMVYSLFMSLKMNYLSMNYWFSYLFFLLMVGGLMVLVMYLTSVSNNEVFSLKNKFYFKILMKIIFLVVIMVYSLKSMDNSFYYFNNEELFSMTAKGWMELKGLFISFKVVVYMFVYLFVLMVVVVMMCAKTDIPMRQMIKYEDN
uniref:NADH dehydrogenase subunit 6 n=1 Tax=Elasmosoma sp. QL-2014 TaxID=1491720 RepID=A0A0U1WYI7_9HYME|nr:NADH dehydrogenase subunit 6 [Elasmosoma sp. QL-2014]